MRIPISGITAAVAHPLLGAYIQMVLAAGRRATQLERRCDVGRVPDLAADKRNDPSSSRVSEELDPLGRTSGHGLASLKRRVG